VTLRLVRPGHRCELCARVMATPQGLTRHRTAVHPEPVEIDQRLVGIRDLAERCGWVVVNDETDCVIIVSAGDPLVVMHIAADGTARCVSRAVRSIEFGTADVAAPVALTLDLDGWDDIRVIVEGHRR